MKTLIYTATLIGVLAFAGAARAGHDRNCKFVHGQVTVITPGAVTVDGHLYKTGDTTHVFKNGEAKATDIQVGDIVCVDTRGKDDVEAEVAAITVLSPEEGKYYHKEKETVREKE